MSDIVEKAEKEVKKVETKISDFFKNLAGQFSADELLKIVAGVIATVLIGIYLFTGLIAVEKEGFLKTVEIVLWGFALGTGAVGYLTKQ